MERLLWKGSKPRCETCKWGRAILCNNSFPLSPAHVYAAGAVCHSSYVLKKQDRSFSEEIHFLSRKPDLWILSIFNSISSLLMNRCQYNYYLSYQINTGVWIAVYFPMINVIFFRISHVNSLPSNIQNNLHFISPTLPMSPPTFFSSSEQSRMPMEDVEPSLRSW